MLTKNTSIFYILWIVVVTLTTSACTTMQTVAPRPEAVKDQFEIGDRIKVYTRDGTVITFDLVEITENAIIGVREQIPFSDIDKIEKSTISITNTAAAGGSVALSLYGTLILAGILSWMLMI